MRILMGLFLGLVLCSAAVGQTVTFGSGVNSFNIEFVKIGEPGNPADTDDGDHLLVGVQNLGSVDYAYRIGKHEIFEHLVNKVNAITQVAGNPLNITHDNRGANKPATSITWPEAMMFVNWLNTSTGYLPAYKFNSEFEPWQLGDVGYNPANPYRNSQAYYFCQVPMDGTKWRTTIHPTAFIAIFPPVATWTRSRWPAERHQARRSTTTIWPSSCYACWRPEP